MQNYNQTISIQISSKERLMQIISIVSFFLAIAFVLLTVLINIAFISCVIFFLVCCIINLVLFGISSKEYLYSINDSSIVIYKKNTFNETKRCLTIFFKDIVSFELFNNIYDAKEQMLFCESPDVEGVYNLIFKTEYKDVSILILPDTYMRNLIREGING